MMQAFICAVPDWKNGYTNRIGVTTRIVTVIRMEVAVCVVASICWIASLEVPEETIVASELAWLIYWYRINCNVYNFVSVTRSSVSWKEFHCPTAAKIATVARIGLIIGRIIEKNTFNVPAPSTSAASCSSLGIDST